MTVTVDLEDPELFRRNDFWSTLQYLRKHDPVYWHPSELSKQGGFWVLTHHDDVSAAYADTRTFSSRSGMNLGSDESAVAAVAQQMLIVSDPPDHTALKRALNEAFNQREMVRLEGTILNIVQRIIADAVEEENLDFIDVAKRLPNHVVCAFMGLPQSDWEWVGCTTTQAFEGPTQQSRRTAHTELFLYLEELLNERRVSPSDDLVSTIVNIAGDDRANGHRLSDLQIILNLNGILSGANETTRYSSAGAVLAFATNPAQWQLLREDTEAVIASAVEEVLRWTVPGLHAMRTLTRECELHGRMMRSGAQVTLWNASANRDESLFADPESFNIIRRPNRHLTFGSGRHVCLGARLARLELSTLMRSLARCIRRVDITGVPVYNGSNFTWGITSLPVRLIAD